MFIDKLRYDDYLSDREASLYKCMELDSLGSPWLPPLLVLDGIANLMDHVDDLEDAHKAMFHGRVGDRGSAAADQLREDTSKFLRTLKADADQTEVGEALACVQTLTLFLLKRVTGADSGGAPLENGGTIARWFRALVPRVGSVSLNSSEDPILRKLLTDPTVKSCLLYTSPSPRDATLSRMPSSA